MDEDLRDQCYRLWEMSKFTVLPNPLEIMHYPAGYINEMFRYHHAVRFYGDIEKRPKDLEE